MHAHLQCDRDGKSAILVKLSHNHDTTASKFMAKMRAAFSFGRGVYHPFSAGAAACQPF